jgi:hypothetical protein
MKRTPSRNSFRPELERLEERETPAMLSASLIGPLLVQQQVTSEVSQMNSLNSQLKTEQSTITTDINNGASAQTIAGDYGKASSTFGQIKALNNVVQTTVKNGELSALLGLLGGKSASKSASSTANNNNNNNNNEDNDDTDENNNANTSSSKSGKSSKSSNSSLLALFSLFSLQQQATSANSILTQATATANTAEPGGFPTIASVS